MKNLVELIDITILLYEHGTSLGRYLSDLLSAFVNRLST